MNKKINIILFTTRCTHALEILNQIKIHNIPLKAIIIQSAGEQPSWWRKLLNQGSIYQLYKQIHSQESDWLKLDYYYRYSPRVFLVNNFNGKNCESAKSLYYSLETSMASICIEPRGTRTMKIPSSSIILSSILTPSF